MINSGFNAETTAVHQDSYLSVTPINSSDTKIELVLNGHKAFDEIVNPQREHDSPLAIVTRLLPLIVAHPSMFASHVLLVSVERLALSYGNHATQVLARIRDRLAPKVEALAGTLGSQIWLSDVHLLIFTGDQTAQHLQDWEDDIRRDMTRLIGEDRGDPVDYFLLSGAQGMRISFTPMAADNIPVIPAQPAEKELPPALTGFRRTSVTGDNLALNVDAHVRSFLHERRWKVPEGHHIAVPGTLYFPILDLTRNLVGTSLAMPGRIVGDKVITGLDAVISEPEGPDHVAEIYAEQALLVGQHIQTMIDRDLAGFVSLQLPYEAVRNQTRLSRVAMAIGNLTKSVRARFVMTLSRVGSEPGEARVREVLQTLGPLVASTIFAVSTREAEWERAFGYGTGVVALRLGSRPGETRNLSMTVEKFVGACRTHHRRSYLGLIDNHEQFDIAQSAGVDFVAGPGVIGVQDFPLSARSWKVAPRQAETTGS